MAAKHTYLEGTRGAHHEVSNGARPWGAKGVKLDERPGRVEAAISSTGKGRWMPVGRWVSVRGGESFARSVNGSGGPGCGAGGNLADVAAGLVPSLELSVVGFVVVVVDGLGGELREGPARRHADLLGPGTRPAERGAPAMRRAARQHAQDP